ncbi:5'-nucleotidase [Kribbella sp. NPDC000426]|uniref:5'-nucleotidase n=1 Tax=Kribbella sp. NPDC000426 TaxID=3154255 RepID=UPI00332FA75E
MAYKLDRKLVVGIASSALFDLGESDAIFRRDGEDAYRQFQGRHLNTQLMPGIAFPFIRRLLSLNDLALDGERLVEVIVLSRNDPDTGLRVMRSIASHGLGISRAIFTQGQAPYRFMPSLNMSLFLSADENSVYEAVAAGLPAGRVLSSSFVDDADDQELRIAFDFDGVLADDKSERVFRDIGITGFRMFEARNLATPHDAGPLRDFLRSINQIQRREDERHREDPSYRNRVRVAIVTARDAPTHERALVSLKAWGLRVNDAFFLGGIDKGLITDVLRPHIYFDDQQVHLERTSKVVPSVHVPFGIANAPRTTTGTDSDD